MNVANGNAALGEARAESHPAWPAVAWICLLALAALLVMHGETLASLLDNWLNADSYGHALLVVPICAWLVWRDRHSLAALSPRPQWLALLAVPVGAVGWLVGDLLSIRVGRELSLHLMVVGVVWATLGTRVTARLAFPLAYLLLTIPFWSLLVPPLQDYTAVVSARSLQAFGVPVFLEGHHMQIPNGQFVVAEVCAGLRFLLATMAIVALHARLSLYSAWRGWLLFLFSVASAILFNWIRVDVIVLAGHLGGMQHPLVTNHIAFGWIMFIVSLVPVMAFSWWLQRGDAPPAPPGADGDSRTLSPGFPSRNAVAAALALLLAVPGVGIAAMIGRDASEPVSVELGEFPNLPGYSGPTPAPTGLDPQFATADVQTEQRYVDADGMSVTVYIAYYAVQREGKEAVSDANRLFAKDWSGSGEAVVPTAGGEGVPDDAIQTLARGPTGASRLIWSWYYAGGRFSTSALHAKLLQVLELPILGARRGGGAMVAISVPAMSTTSFEARQALTRFSELLLPQLKEQFANVTTTW